ncbi:MAG: TadE/TadG family type IV pilus assembly protein [Novosphingobium sp.]
MTLLRAFLKDELAATTAEFALVVPLFILFVFGAIDVGGFAWKINKLEKATQMGARMAVVTDPVATALLTESYIGKAVTVGGTTVTLTQGSTIPAEALGKTVCTTSGCSCSANCLSASTANSTALTNVANRMRVFDSSIQDSNVQIEYVGSGLGYAGDPDGMEIAPLVTVRLVNMQYQPMVGVLLNAAIDLPDFAFTLPMEDGSGTTSN